jgi:hypothetical protein
MLELNERKIVKNNEYTGLYSFDWFCKTPEKLRFSVFSCVNSVKLADKKEENERYIYLEKLGKVPLAAAYGIGSAKC